MVRANGLVLLVATLLAAIVSALVTPSPILLISPGPALELAPLVDIPADRRQEEGHLYLTAVELRSATYAEALRAQVDPTIALLPRAAVQPSGISVQQFRMTQESMIEESKQTAEAVAFRQAGYDVDAQGHGAAVRAVVADSPADGTLREGDVIVALNGVPLATAPELTRQVRALPVGTTVRLDVERAGARRAVVVQTGASRADPAISNLGVMVGTVGLDVATPIPVAVVTEHIGGSSAGLMFGLAIYDALTPGPLGGGRPIAGTGTIALDGQVGEVDGVAQKVIAAERAGASFFLVPPGNADEARAHARRLQVVAVASLGDAVAFLRTLG